MMTTVTGQPALCLGFLERSPAKAYRTGLAHPYGVCPFTPSGSIDVGGSIPPGRNEGGGLETSPAELEVSIYDEEATL
jgi:hypothetical protein